MYQSSSWEADSRSVSQKFLHFLWNPNIYRRVHEILPLDRISSQLIHIIFIKLILILSSYLRLGFVSVLFYPGFWNKFCMHFSLLHTCHMPRSVHANNIWWRAKTMKLHIMWIRISSCQPWQGHQLFLIRCIVLSAVGLVQINGRRPLSAPTFPVISLDSLYNHKCESLLGKGYRGPPN